MCEGQTFGAFVTERLAAAAGETTECEEEELRRAGEVRVDTGQSLKREIPETSRIKEEPQEQSVTREDEQLPVCFPESRAVFVEREAVGGAENKCPFCDKRFCTKANLTRHIRVHTGQKPYRCSTCQKTFNQTGTLISHRRTHTGERPYSCSTCQKTFAREWNLAAHRRTHTAERPYSCQVCEKRFTQLSNLNTHRRTHTRETTRLFNL